MGYKLVNWRPKHDEMLESIGKTIFLLDGDMIKTAIITGVGIDPQTKKWKFNFDREQFFSKNELIFKNVKSVKRYIKKRGK